MTNEKAIQLLHRLSDEQFDGEHGDERREALEMAVRALEGDGDTISRKMAIDAVAKWFYDVITEPDGTATIFERLRELPSAQPETHDKRTETHACDLSNRQQAIEAFEPEHHTDWYTPTIIKTLEELPQAQPQREKGKWIPVDSFSAFGGDEAMWMAHGNPVAFYYCSECKEQAYAGEDGESLLTDFCPSCGADMRGENDA